jgi:hypothetical protein
MLKIHRVFIVLGMLLSSLPAAHAQISIGIGLPNVNIGINLPVYPELVVVPGYPVYYAPQAEANYFFYDGMYWVYQNDNWYASSWYNGPWTPVAPEAVPLFVLRVPVRYYRQPPAYFFGWGFDEAPRWGEYWGGAWQQQRRGWNRWDRGAVPPPAPLPDYQRQYSGSQYPQQVQQQHQLQQHNYHYQPHDPVVRKQFRGEAAQGARVQQAQPRHEMQQQERMAAPAQRGANQPDIRRAAPRPPNVPATERTQPPQAGRAPVQDQRRQPQPGSPQMQQHNPPPQAATRQAQQAPARKPQGETKQEHGQRDQEHPHE